jgi:hypothetical protein
MAISMYEVSIPVLIRNLNNLAAVLQKGAAHAEAKKIDPSVLLNSRIFPDMFPLARQVQIASDNAKGCAARLAGVEVPKWEDNETTFADLAARIQKTIDYLNTFKPEQIDGSEDRAITIKMRDSSLEFTGKQYLLVQLFPNFFFHMTTAYNILRHNGVEIGKKDFMGRK